MRKTLGLFANLRPAKVLPQLVSASTLKPEVVSGVDIMVRASFVFRRKPRSDRAILSLGPEAIGGAHASLSLSLPPPAPARWCAS